MALEQTMRWYGPKDSISLNEIRQTGATGIVTALHHIPNGEVWSVDEITKRQKDIEMAGLRWSVVESVPVHENIKKQVDNYQQYIENYKQTLLNLGHCGIDTVCYNFMSVLDWSRTSLFHQLEDGKKALIFNIVEFAAFDIYILKRPKAESDYTNKVKDNAKQFISSLSDESRQILINTILQGLPGSEESFSLESFQTILDEYKGIDEKKLKTHLFHFLKEVIPVAEKAGIRMAIHPDDPPKSLLGLPRIVSSIDDIRELTSVVNSPSNGITMCTGSFGADIKNNIVNMTKEMAHRINFIHLRNVSRDIYGNFMEKDHLGGDIDMYEVMKELITEERRRKKAGRKDWRMPMRPDHGHLMLDDQKKQKTYPGYSLIGRMKGLAELRGLEIGIEKSLKNE